MLSTKKDMLNLFHNAVQGVSFTRSEGAAKRKSAKILYVICDAWVFDPK